MLFLATIPSSQASHSEQTTVETEPTLNSDLYMGFGILIILLIILFLGFMSYQKESQVPPKAPVKRKKKAVKKTIVEEEPVEEKPVKKKTLKKAIKGSKTYTSNNVEIVELTRRKKRKVKRKKRKR
jgi:Na+-transporting methylmalonyl-CoA/oxaloacetate decarboxylase gamma subunit